MEFDKNVHEPEDQLLDADKKMVLNPLTREDQIEAEQSNAEIATAHANGPAIGNFSGDIEATGGEIAKKEAEHKASQLLAMHKAANPPKQSKVPISIIAVLIMIGVLLFALLYR